jgi:hypothetical protein
MIKKLKARLIQEKGYYKDEFKTSVAGQYDLGRYDEIIHVLYMIEELPKKRLRVRGV